MKHSKINCDIGTIISFINVRLLCISAFNVFNLISKTDLIHRIPRITKDPFSPVFIEDSSSIGRFITDNRKTYTSVSISIDNFESALEEYINIGLDSPDILKASQAIKDFHERRRGIASYVASLHSISSNQPILDRIEDVIPKVLLPSNYKNLEIIQEIVEVPYDNPSSEETLKNAIDFVQIFKDEIYIWEVENLLR